MILPNPQFTDEPPTTWELAWRGLDGHRILVVEETGKEEELIVGNPWVAVLALPLTADERHFAIILRKEPARWYTWHAEAPWEGIPPVQELMADPNKRGWGDPERYSIHTIHPMAPVDGVYTRVPTWGAVYGIVADALDNMAYDPDPLNADQPTQQEARK